MFLKIHLFKPTAVFDCFRGSFANAYANSQTYLEGKQQENIRVSKKGDKSQFKGECGYKSLLGL